MDDVMKMYLLLFATTTVVVVLGASMVFVFWRIARILKHFEHVSEQIALESDTIRLDLALLRSDIRRGKGRLKSLFDFFGKTKKRTSK